MYSIGYDIGSSSIKASLVEYDSGKVVAGIKYPDDEMKINSEKKDGQNKTQIFGGIMYVKPQKKSLKNPILIQDL